jgi:hypothetical protein
MIRFKNLKFVKNRNNIIILLSLFSLLFSIFQYFNSKQENITPYLDVKLINSDSFDFSVENLGNGTAKNIQIIYKINPKNFQTKDNNNYFIKLLFPENFWENEITEKIFIEKNSLILKDENIYLLKKDDKINIKINHNILNILNLLINNNYKLKDPNNLMNIKIVYYDIFDKKYQINLKYQVEIFFNDPQNTITVLELKLLKI